MKKALILGQALLFVMLTGSTTSCTKECDTTKTETLTLDDEPLSKVPYAGNEKIVFLYENEQSSEWIEFQGDGRHKFTINQTRVDEKECNIKVNKESFDINFFTADQSEKINMNVTAEPHGSIFSIFFNGELFRDDFKIIGNSSYAHFYPEIEFNGTKFINVTKVVKQVKNHEVIMFYSPQKGIIRFDYGNGETWTLKQ